MAVCLHRLTTFHSIAVVIRPGRKDPAFLFAKHVILTEFAYLNPGFGVNSNIFISLLNNCSVLN